MKKMAKIISLCLLVIIFMGLIAYGEERNNKVILKDGNPLASVNNSVIKFDKKTENNITTYENPISYKTVDVNISTGTKKVKVIKVNPKHPDIRFEVNIPNTTLNRTAEFVKQVKEKGAIAAINGNFFQSYDEIKDPIGNLMINGNLVYGQSGFTTVGITKNKEIVFSNPATFVSGATEGKFNNESNESGDFQYNKWTAYEINTLTQSSDSAILYTPERGDDINITSDGYVAVIEDNVVTKTYSVTASNIVNIPKNGYVIYFGKDEGYRWNSLDALQVGRKVDYKYNIIKNTNESFKWEDMNYAISGGPDLVTEGKLAPPSNHIAFSGKRFTEISTSRTALGVTKDEQLILVSASGVKINELKEIMLSLGAYNAINLDGGGSTAMYYNGKTLTKPGRKLVTVLYVYKL